MEYEDPLIQQKLVLVLFFLFLATILCGLKPAFASEILSPPETITVRVTGMKDCRDQNTVYYQTTQIDFKEYVKGVLPNEWLSSWDIDALKAGAVAVKMYGWSVYYSQGFVWDCNWNQVYDPTARTERTDRAVEETWDWVFWNNGPVRTYYDDYPAACASRDHECMSQWRTKESAERGLSWKEILNKNYDGDLICSSCDLSHSVKNGVFNLERRLYIIYQFEFAR